MFPVLLPAIVLSILGVIGTVLKWILWILLGLLGLVLLIVLIVLLDPFFYRIRGHKEQKDIRADARVYYLFHIIKVTVSFEEKTLAWRVTVFGKQIAGSDEVPEKDRSREGRKKRREEAAAKAAQPEEAAEPMPSDAVEEDAKSLTELVDAQKDKAQEEAKALFEEQAASEAASETAACSGAAGVSSTDATGSENAAGAVTSENVEASAAEAGPKAEIVITDKAKSDQARLEEAIRRARQRADAKVEAQRAKEEKELLAAAQKDEKEAKKFQKELEKLRKQKEKNRLKEEKAKEKQRKKEEAALLKQKKKEEALRRKNEPGLTLSEKIDRAIDNVLDKIDLVLDFIDKVLDAPDTLEEKLEPYLKYLEMFEDYPDKDKTIKALLRVLGRVLKPLVPKGCNIDALIGTGDPYLTARILSVYLPLAPLLFPKQSKKRYLNIQTDMMEKVLDFDATLKGRFNIGSIIGPVLGAPFNRYIFRLIKFAFKLYKQSKKNKEN